MNKIKKGNLTIDSVLFEFVNQEVIPGTDIDAEDFWNKFDLAVHELAPINKALIEKRESFQSFIRRSNYNKTVQYRILSS